MLNGDGGTAPFRYSASPFNVVNNLFRPETMQLSGPALSFENPTVYSVAASPGRPLLVPGRSRTIVATQRVATPHEALPIIQPETTYTGSPILPLRKGLPKTTESLCPECSSVIEAIIREEGGRVIMQKTCPEHGSFRDLIFSDARLYLKMEQWTFGRRARGEEPHRS